MYGIDLDYIEAMEQESPDFADLVFKAATYYVINGFHVLPLVRNGKGLVGDGISYYSASSNPDTIYKWFGPGGKYRGHNIGIACGKEQGVFAVDLDMGEHDAIQDFYAMNTMNGGEISAVPVQTTPSGGKHLLFKWFPGGKSSSAKIAPGIDTRGGSHDRFGGHIVAWPSKVDGGQYRWDRKGILASAPDWLINSMGQSHLFAGDVPEHIRKGQGRGNEHVDTGDFEYHYSIRELGRIMQYINIEDLTYDEWVWVGQAIHSQHPTAKGLELWDRWSQTGSRYKQNECNARWPGFAQDRGITAGTLVEIAKRYGYDPRTRGKDVVQTEEAKDSLVDEMNKKFAVVVVGGTVRVLMEKKPSEIDPTGDRFVLMDRGGFSMLMDNDKIAALNAGGKPVLMNKADVWLADEKRRTYPAGLIFSPGDDRDVDGYFNTWQPWPVKESSNGSWEMFQEHLKFNICGGDATYFNWLVDWMADIVQDPKNPKGSCVVLSGDEGNGKGTFCHIFGKLFGSHYKHVTDEEHLVGRFNGHLQDAIFVFADEVTYGGSKKVAGKLKAMVTEPVLMVERKGVDAHKTTNYVRLAIASNEKWFIPAGPNSRRWFVLNVRNNRANDWQYFKDMRQQMDEGGYERMMYDLKNRKITSNLRYAPVTEGLMMQRAILSGQDSVVSWWVSCLESCEIPGIANHQEFDPSLVDNRGWPDLMKIPSAAMYSIYEEDCLLKRNKKKTQQEFAQTMGKFGLKKERVRKGDKRVMAYVIPEFFDACAACTKSTGIIIDVKPEGNDDE